ncbi:hypothetical protein CPC08DRAFT_423943 [Agrocybe pediades]|nr:hypothetical protein CPC08DRAFT_423943 [Agrocybe pediades]
MHIAYCDRARACWRMRWCMCIILEKVGWFLGVLLLVFRFLYLLCFFSFVLSPLSRRLPVSFLLAFLFVACSFLLHTARELQSSWTQFLTFPLLAAFLSSSFFLSSFHLLGGLVSCVVSLSPLFFLFCISYFLHVPCAARSPLLPIVAALLVSFLFFLWLYAPSCPLVCSRRVPAWSQRPF